jgi:cell division protein FtsW (lipid II flippase)
MERSSILILLCVQWKTPDDVHRNCPKHVEFHSKNKFEKLVHLVGFIIRNLTRRTVTRTSNITLLYFICSYSVHCLSCPGSSQNTSKKWSRSWKAVTQPPNKLPKVYGSGMLNTAFANTRQWLLFWATVIQFIPTQSLSLKSVFVIVFPSNSWSSKHVSFPQVCRPKTIHRNYNVK